MKMDKKASNFSLSLQENKKLDSILLNLID